AIHFCGLKGIKREFSVPRTPQQNGIAERKNSTFIEVTRTMLENSLLPILFWAEAVNTACYVQNRELVTKPHKGKAFRVFNCRTCIIQETLHVIFLENKPNVAGTGPTWLFDINNLSGTMNYHPITAGKQTNSGACFQESLDVEKVGEEVDQSYMLFPVWSSVGSINPQNNADDAAFDRKERDFDVKKPESKVIISSSSSAQSKEQDDKTMKEAKGKSHVESVTGYRDLNTDAAGLSNTAVSPTYRDASQFLDDLDMPGLEDIIYYDDENVVGVEADFNNLESSIPVSPIPTTSIHKDHPISQIIGDLSLTTQTREEPKRAHQALKDPSWIEAMQEELLQLKMQKVWVLVDLPYGKRAIVARIEAMRLFLASASFMGFMVYQMDVNSAFLYGTIEEEVLFVVYIKLLELGMKPWPPIFLKMVFKEVKQKEDGIFISQDKYVAKMLRKFGLTEDKSASTPIDTEKPVLKDPDGEDVDVHIYRSMIGSLM
nr:hypothetical protein [Tanacetum cinerariifolium]